MQRALVTGASRGIGRALAAELAGRGLDVVATAQRVDDLADLPAAQRLPLDVTSDASVTAAARSAGPVDLLVPARALLHLHQRQGDGHLGVPAARVDQQRQLHEPGRGARSQRRPRPAGAVPAVGADGAGRLAVGGVAVQIGGGSVIFGSLTVGLSWLCVLAHARKEAVAPARRAPDPPLPEGLRESGVPDDPILLHLEHDSGPAATCSDALPAGARWLPSPPGPWGRLLIRCCIE